MSHNNAENAAWQLLLAAREVQRSGADRACHLYYDKTLKKVNFSDNSGGDCMLWLNENGQWRFADNLPELMDAMFTLYLPVLEHDSKNSQIIAHMGQSIDSCIATLAGDSFYVTGEKNRKHLHCLRGLCDAVIVGAGTVVADDPQLTTRAVTGPNPVRVLIDPQARLQQPLRVFDDAQANTLLLHQSSVELGQRRMQFGPEIEDCQGQIVKQVERQIVPDSDDKLSMTAVVSTLRARGLSRLFIEGGGVTVSRFLKEDLINRLHVAIAPLIVGEGIPALQTAGVPKMADALRASHLVYRMGEDILWDFDLGKRAADSLDPAMPSVGEDGVFIERII